MVFSVSLSHLCSKMLERKYMCTCWSWLYKIIKLCFIFHSAYDFFLFSFFFCCCRCQPIIAFCTAISSPFMLLHFVSLHSVSNSNDKVYDIVLHFELIFAKLKLTFENQLAILSPHMHWQCTHSHYTTQTQNRKNAIGSLWFHFLFGRSFSLFLSLYLSSFGFLSFINALLFAHNNFIIFIRITYFFHIPVRHIQAYLCPFFVDRTLLIFIFTDSNLIYSHLQIFGGMCA